MKDDVGMHHAKIISFLSNTIKDTIIQPCITPPYILYSSKGVTNDCASILDSSTRGTYIVSTIFHMVYPYTSPFLDDIYTYFCFVQFTLMRHP